MHMFIPGFYITNILKSSSFSQMPSTCPSAPKKHPLYRIITFLIAFAILLKVPLGNVSAVPNLMLCEIVTRNWMMFIFIISMPNVTFLCHVKYMYYRFVDQIVTCGAVCLVCLPFQTPKIRSKHVLSIH